MPSLRKEDDGGGGEVSRPEQGVPDGRRRSGDQEAIVQSLYFHGGGHPSTCTCASAETECQCRKPSSQSSGSVSKPVNTNTTNSTTSTSRIAHKKAKGAGAASIITKSASPGIAGPCPDFVYYVVKGWLPTTQKTTTAAATASARPRKQSKVETSLPSDTLLLLPRNDYDYWHYRLNLYLCNTWGDVRSLGESVYGDVKRRFLRIHAVKGYRYSEKDEDFFADDDRFNIWEDLGCHDARLQAVFSEAEWTYPYSIRKIMYDDTRRGAGVPFELRNSPKYLSGGKADRNWEAEMVLPAEDRTTILNLIKTSGGKVREEPGLQDFLIADVRYGRYSLDEIDTPFIREYRQAKLSDPKYDLVKERNRHACEKLKAAQAEREAERAAREAPPPPNPPLPLPPPPPPAMQHDPFGLGRPPPPPALLQQNVAVIVSEEEESDESFQRLRDRLLHNDKGIKYEYVPESSTEGPASIPFGTNILCCFTTGWDIGRVTDKRQCNSKQKSEAKQMICPVLVYYESDGMYWLHDLGLDDAPYLSAEIFQQLVDGKFTEEEEKGYLGYWCIVSPPENGHSRAEAAKNKNDGNQKKCKGIAVYDDKDEKWNKIFQDMIKFKERMGHLEANYMKDPILYKWMTAQRYLLRDKSPRMTPEKKKCLDDVGFDWKGYERFWTDPPENAEEAEGDEKTEESKGDTSDDPQTPGIHEKDTSDAKWNNMFHELCVFKAKNGHMNLVSTDLRYKWANRQRHACRDNIASFTSEKKRLLDSIGFNWRGFDADWKDGAGDAGSSDVYDANGKAAAAKAEEKGSEGPTPMEADESDGRKEVNEDEEKK